MLGMNVNVAVSGAGGHITTSKTGTTAAGSGGTAF
jgi:hypothetical protein